MARYRIMAKDVVNGTRIVHQSLAGDSGTTKEIAQDTADALAEVQSKRTRRKWVGVIELIPEKE